MIQTKQEQPLPIASTSDKVIQSGNMLKNSLNDTSGCTLVAKTASCIHKINFCCWYKLFASSIILSLVAILANNILASYSGFMPFTSNHRANLILLLEQNFFPGIILLISIIILFIFYKKIILPIDGLNKNLMHEIIQLKEENSLLEKKHPEQADSPIDRENFLNNISHEVRTPIQGINAISKGLVSNWYNFDNKTNYELASKIAHNSQRLFSLIDNILELSKLKSGRTELKFHKVNLLSLLQDMADECRNFYFHNKDLVIDISYNLDLQTTILVDEDKITQVIRNLLSNAIKITPSGRITLEAKKNNGYVVISVIDEGPGIPANRIKNIFTQNKNKNNAGGAGIGLIVAQAIIKAHGGKIWAANNEQKGARFSFTIALSSSKPSAYIKPELCSTTKAAVMVIDDEETCLLSISMMFHQSNYILHKFSSPIQALEFLHDNPQAIDIILLDMMMPELDGLEVLEALNSHNILKNIPVIMQSGVADMQQINSALSIGVRDFIRKPYTKETLITAIENILQSKNKI